MTSREIIEQYVKNNFQIVTWPQIGDIKGPTEKGWTNKRHTLADYHDGNRVGLFTGIEVSPGKFLHDIDIDWAPGSLIAQRFIPSSDFAFGRVSKPLSHVFVLLPEPLPSMRFEDIDKSCLIELRGTKQDGTIGMQTMVPPSIWSRENQREELIFFRSGAPTFCDNSGEVIHAIRLSAIGMILAKNLGKNGFGHDVRLAWAGFLLRAGLLADDLIKMGEAISKYTNNIEIKDVRTTVESTALRLKIEGQKVKGGPALAGLIGDNGKAVIARINEWLGRESDFIRIDGKIQARNQENIRRALDRLNYSMSCDQFSAKLLCNNKTFDDFLVNSVYLQIEQEFHFAPPRDYYQIVVEDIAWTNSFHPVLDYLRPLVWDGTPRIDTWLIQSAKVVDNPYVQAVSAIMLIAAVRRVRQPGCKYDEMVVWESIEQGLDKSTAAQTLCPNPDWFSDDFPLNAGSQRLIEATVGKWIIEASDLAGKRKTQIEHLKAMMSRQRDGPVRLAYKHFPEERPRHFILIGTTNDSEYLNDPTGARRFWPMKIKRFNVEWIKQNRDQLWAEASAREQAGASIRLAEELWPAARAVQDARQEIDSWEEVIKDLLDNILPSASGRKTIATNLVWEAVGIEVARRDRRDALRISDIFRKLGYQRGVLREGDKLVRGYRSPPTNFNFSGEEDTDET